MISFIKELSLLNTDNWATGSLKSPKSYISENFGVPNHHK